MSVAEALTILHPGEWILEGEPTSEAEFHASFSVITGTDSNGSSILSSDVSDFQVNWATISAKSTQIENDRPAKTVRVERDNRLLEVDAIAGNALRWAALDADTQAAWSAYRQALLDVPQQSGFPHSVTWPTKP
mgnify:CR=1 FL=1